MKRFFSFSLWSLLVSAALIAVVCVSLRYRNFHIETVNIHSVSEFDFASYAFGLVAVALSFAGIYISIILEDCSEQLYKLLIIHFVPFPFNDILALEKNCHPSAAGQGFTPTAGLRCAHAIVSLRKWSALSANTKQDLLGSNGLGAGRSWFGAIFDYFQSGKDRLLVAAIGVSTALIYVALPVAYWFDYELLAASMLVSIYLMCVLEILVCSLLYLTRWFFIGAVSSEMPKWLPEMTNALVTATMTRATAAAP